MAAIIIDGTPVAEFPMIQKFVDYSFPVGTVYETTSADLSTVTQMNSHFAGTTWDVFGSGRVTVGVGTTRYPNETIAVPRTNYTAPNQTGGAEAVALTVAQIPLHTHPTVSITTTAGNDQWDRDMAYPLPNMPEAVTQPYTQFTGNNQPHSNVQPYVTVYRYVRVA